MEPDLFLAAERKKEIILPDGSQIQLQVDFHVSLSLFYREGFKVCYQHSHGTQQVNPNNFSDPRPDLSSSAGQGFDLSLEICQNLLLGGLQMAFGVAR